VKILLGAAVLLLLPAAAYTQGNPGPFGGLFGRTPTRAGIDYRLFEIRGSGGWQWNDVLFEQATAGPGPVYSGIINHAAGGATYERKSDRFNLRAGSNVEYRHSPTSQRVRGTSIDGGLLVGGHLTTRVSADVSANYRQSPYFHFFPSFVWQSDGVVAPGLPYEVTSVGYHQGEVRGGGSFQYSKSSTLSASVLRTETRFPTSPTSNVTRSGYEGLWTRRLNRDFSVRLGYGRSQIRHRSALGEFIEERIEVGVDFHKALTLSPRTLVAFTTHTSVLRDSHREPYYRLNGDFMLTRRFRRTWKLQFNVSRATDFDAGYVEPLFTDSIALSTSGLLAKRVELVTVVRGSYGQIGYGRNPGRVAIAGAITQVNFAVTRRFGLYSQYAFYHHDAPVDALSIAAVGRLSRQTLTAGIATWVPLYVRERTPLDPR
jgi:hypothetical protein